MSVDNLIKKLESEASKLKGAPAGVTPPAQREFVEQPSGDFADTAEVPVPESMENMNTERLQVAKDFVDLGKVPMGYTPDRFQKEYATEIEMAKQAQATDLAEFGTKEGDPELLKQIDKFAEEPTLKTVDEKGNLQTVSKTAKPKNAPKK